MTIGAGAVSSFIVSALIGVYYLLQHLLAEKQSKEAELARSYGLMGYLPQRPYWKVSGEPPAPFARATYIDVLEVSAYTICQHNEEQDFNRLQARKIRVLLLDPRYPDDVSFAAERDAEEGRAGTAEVFSEVCEFLRKFGSGGPAEPLEVKLTTSMPTMSYFRWDHTICWAPLLYKLDGHSVLHTWLAVASPLGTELASNFERLWCSASPPDDDLCTKGGYCHRHQPVVRSRAPTTGSGTSGLPDALPKEQS